MMRAKFIKEESGYYPPGAENDPSAPYNEPIDNYTEIVELNDYDEVKLIKRRYIDEEDWEDEEETIDYEKMDEFLSGKLGIDYKKLVDSEETVEIKDIQDLGKGKYIFDTNFGKTEVSFWELESLI